VLNWIVRYSAAMALLDERGWAAGSILDVGCGPHGLSCVRPELLFVGLDVEFGERVSPTMTAIKAPPGRLPFADESFDTVLSLDTLEHIPPPQRALFVAELGRVSAGRVVLACPERRLEAADRLVASMIVATGLEAPAWLGEHEEFGLPREDEVVALGAAVAGFSARPFPTVNALLSVLAVVADVHPALVAQAVDEVALRTEEWERLFLAGRFGPSARATVVLERDVPKRAVVEAGALRASMLQAMRCVPCGGSIRERTATVWVCDTCQRLALLDEATDAWDLGTAPVSRASVSVAPHVEPLRIRVSWMQMETWLPVVTRLLGHRTTPMVVELQGADAPLDVAEAGLAALREYGPWPGDVALLAAPLGSDGDAVTAEKVLAVAGATSVAGVPAAVLAHARAAKALADHVQAAMDRRQWETTILGDGRLPLVSVPIHTWRGVETLVGRAIPSVLNGSHQNVEVVVCSDGPDPDARAAVEAIDDPRVRYLELASRPAYAAHPYNFWLTAGTAAANRARGACRGDWVAPLDHDDAFTIDHVSVLLGAALATGADVTYGRAVCEHPDGGWFVLGSGDLAVGQVTHGAVLWSRRVAHLRYDPLSWLLVEPGDWNLIRRAVAAGATTAFCPEPVLVHYREKSSVSADERIDRPHHVDQASVPDPDLAADVRTTGDWLLSVTLPERVR
jgi:SAM-dependent methyltransferase